METPITPSASVSTPTPSPTPSASASVSPSPAVTPSSTPTAPSPTASTSATASGEINLSGKHLAGVLSPSGGIACLFTDLPRPAVRCDVQGAHWQGIPPRPKRCEGGYGDSVELGADKPSLQCHSDTVFGAPDQPTLAYGATAVYHRLRCESARTGITCRNAAGHGFSVSREAVGLF